MRANLCMCYREKLCVHARACVFVCMYKIEREKEWMSFSPLSSCIVIKTCRFIDFEYAVKEFFISF